MDVLACEPWNRPIPCIRIAQVSTSSPHPSAGVKAPQKASSQAVSHQDFSSWNCFQPAIFTSQARRGRSNIRQPTNQPQSGFSTEPHRMDQLSTKPVENHPRVMGNLRGKSIRDDSLAALIMTAVPHGSHRRGHRLSGGRRPAHFQATDSRGASTQNHPQRPSGAVSIQACPPL